MVQIPKPGDTTFRTSEDASGDVVGWKDRGGRPAMVVSSNFGRQ